MTTMTAARGGRHLSQEALEDYVMGALDDARAAIVEAHAASCPECEAALQREARLELAFTQVARASAARSRRRRTSTAPPRAPRRAPVAGGAVAGGALAMAAAVVLWLVPISPWPSAQGRTANGAGTAQATADSGANAPAQGYATDASWDGVIGDPRDGG